MNAAPLVRVTLPDGATVTSDQPDAHERLSACLRQVTRDDGQRPAIEELERAHAVDAAAFVVLRTQ